MTPAEILDELDRAIGNHLIWLKEWHREIACGSPPFAHELSYDPHHLCRFGTWYVRHQHRGLMDQPALHTLSRLHRDMHDRAHALMGRARSGEILDRADYDAFADSFNAFLAQARRLEKAFSQAHQDLDPLTGVHNRQAMTRELERERERHLRTGEPCCIALADLDHFKAVNDTYGHQTGDKVLALAAESFLTSLRPFDYVFRYGGEEFLLFLPNTTLDTGKQAVERLRETLAVTPIPLNNNEKLPVTASFGLAELIDTATVEATIERADQALYWAKDQGRNRVVAWDGAAQIDALSAN
ncbi:diguanylate cyclase [Magnetospira sp. QH-2]|uniref:diguanylate cyclase n=1 Tax=Magnetospira sp. (strain QH-2) TaxID=1288970 RepID=UPI0003E816AE|nr:diguanylate cyclase [Magnetospira sp. QH-2]CCQ74051.1 putative Diguanylate cyclase [Magnetospira sp. QH-2]